MTPAIDMDNARAAMEQAWDTYNAAYEQVYANGKEHASWAECKALLAPLSDALGVSIYDSELYDLNRRNL